MNVIGCVAIVALDTPRHIWKHICIENMCNFVLLRCACKLPLQNVYEETKCLYMAFHSSTKQQNILMFIATN
jgi:hypothetical protein